MREEIDTIRKLIKELKVLVDNAEKRGRFNKVDLEILQKIGSDIVFKGCSIDYYLEVKDER